ncbi:MAG: Ig-like domain-containing protein [Bacteroidetes bacterium]|nr:Ig-like domain-containing protein [Bacteroidota bacterium]MBU1113861.1 Ig-like domain-containing protein [Bacteroidota bacterium]MBU1798113.1 Ig-like domain-containing protein [Bacteroidota bacterium]
MKQISKYLLILTIGVALIKCANQQTPPGGPKDTIPPKIINVFPANGTLNFTEDYLEIDFSEYVEKLSLLDALFISPEIKNLDYSWTGTSVKITFDDTLLVNTTYTVSIGSNIKDLNNQNQMEEAVNFSFSTGNKIDVGKISGKIFDDKLTGTMVFAYMKADSFANPISEKSHNITQVGENGEFQLLGLKNGDYRLFAVKDENGNRLYNIGDDAYGVTSKIIKISDSLNSIDGINFKLSREDTLAPFISNVTMTDKNHLSVEYSEYLDSLQLSNSNFYVYDSTNNYRKNIKYLYQGNKSKHEYFLAFEDTLYSNARNYLVVENIYDKYLNIMKYETYEFVINEKPDTVAPKIKNISTPFEKDKIDYLNPSFTLNYSDAISLSQLEKAFLLDKYKWEIKKYNDASFLVNILNNLETNEKIEFKINQKIIIDAAGNSYDSLENYTLETLSGREFSGMSGKIDPIDSLLNIIVAIENTENKEIKYFTKAKVDKTYSFERILPGKYTVWMFDDLNEDGKYNYGKINPFVLSEDFIVYPDTLNLRARWPVGDVNLKFQK